MHFTLLGSGCHSPFLIHVDDSGPKSMKSKWQLKLTVVPSITGMTCVLPVTLIDPFISEFSCCTGGCPQLAIIIRINNAVAIA